MRMRKIDFRLGCRNLALEVPPFFLNFEKRNFSSIMTRGEQQLKCRRSLFYIYISRDNQLSKLLLLKALHPSLYIPHSFKVNEDIGREEVNGFIDSVKYLEKKWKYVDSGLWKRNFNGCSVYMVVIIGEDRWTIRPIVSKECLKGYGVEIPVDAERDRDFLEDLTEDEKTGLEIHEHVQNRHFHFTVSNIERFIELVKEWDYYFANKEIWKQSVRITCIE
ncbi:MAG: hypothetical protein QXI36_03195 [Candidatus Bathyarchaeia archaeon]